MMESVLSILQWAFPSGLSIVNLFLMRSLLKRNKSKITKDTIEVWRDIAQLNGDNLLDKNQEILKQNEEILHLRLSLSQFEEILKVITRCKYYNLCPVRSELQKYKDYKRTRKNRQHFYHRKTASRTRDDPGQSNEPDGSGNDVEAATEGGDIFGAFGDEFHDAGV